ncbi:hypothetical protein BGY98DRAFT_1096376 [Russula aff. rugulosa BPL654]|nr:hypothetical protein BGY98DRAFT_1096376 [Russula aff. rugulosa BPL654]
MSHSGASVKGYESVDGEFLFWYSEGIAHIAFTDKTRLADIPPALRSIAFRSHRPESHILQDVLREAFGYLLVNFNRIWVIHVSVWFYTAYNALTIYHPRQCHSSALTWSATALGSAVATVIVILATLTEFSYILIAWNNTSHLTCWLPFLLVTLALTAGPTFYIVIVENWRGGGTLAVILGIAQFFISIGVAPAVWNHASGRMFGDQVTQVPRVSCFHGRLFDPMVSSVPVGALLQFLVFGCKFRVFGVLPLIVLRKSQPTGESINRDFLIQSYLLQLFAHPPPLPPNASRPPFPNYAPVHSHYAFSQAFSFQYLMSCNSAASVVITLKFSLNRGTYSPSWNPSLAMGFHFQNLLLDRSVVAVHLPDPALSP